MKYVLVTGAYGGMGQETVKLLKQKGYGHVSNMGGILQYKGDLEKGEGWWKS